MGYDLFSQLQGPQIDIDLFGRNTARGIDAGNALPTSLTAGIQGAIKGVQTGQQLVQNQQAITANDQQEVIRQNQIDRIPQANEAADIELQNAKNIEEINALKVKRARALDLLATDAEESKLNLEVASADEKVNTIRQKEQFTNEFQASDPATQAQMVLGGKYAGLFQSDPKLYTQKLQEIFNNSTRNGLSPEETQKIGQVLKIRGVVDAGDKQAAKYQAAYDAAHAQVETATWASQSSDRLGTTPVDAATKIKMVPHGMYAEEDGNLIPDTTQSPGSKIYKQSDSYLAGGGKELAKGSWDIIDPETDTILDNTGTVGDAEYKQWADFNAKRKLVDRTYTNRKVAGIVDEEKPKIKPVGVATFGNAGKPVPATEKETDTPLPKDTPQLLKHSISTTLNIKPEALIGADEAINSLDAYIHADAEKRNSPMYKSTYSRAVGLLVGSIAEKEYEASPAIQATYTDQATENYNKVLHRKVFRASSPLEDGGFYDSPKNQVYEALKVEGPLQLYTTNRYAAISNAIDSSVIAVLNNKVLSQTSAIRTTQSTQNNLAFLSGVARNGPNSGQ